MSEKILPHSKEFEQGVLGAILLKNNLITPVREIVKSGDFYTTLHKHIFGSMVELIDAGNPCDTTTLVSHLKGLGANFEASTVTDLTSQVPSLNSASYYAEEVKRLSILRAFIHQYSGLADRAFDPTCDPVELLSEAQKSAAKLNASVSTKERIKAIEIKDLLKLELPPRENILSPWLPKQGLAMIYAARGIGKTQVSLSIALAVSSGGTLFSWEAEKPRKVLFIDGEMPAATIQKRLAHFVAGSQFEPKHLNIITPDLQSSGIIDLSNPVDQASLEPFLEGVDLVIADNLSTLCRSGKESEGEGWLPVQDWALRQRAAGRSVLFIHHAGKNGAQRGTSRREDILDTVIVLRHPANYSPDAGACFEVHFEKARGICGAEVKPFEAQLKTGPDGKSLEWTTKSIEDSTAEKVARMLNEGYQQKDIAEELGITPGAVSKAKNKANELGLLNRSKGLVS